MSSWVSLCGGSSDQELCKFGCASWGLCLPRYAQWPKNLHLNPSVLTAQYSLHFHAGAAKIQHSLWATASRPAVWLEQTYSPTVVMSGWHALLLRSDILQILDGLGSFMDVSKVSKKIWTSSFAWSCGVFWIKWTTNHFWDDFRPLVGRASLLNMHTSCNAVWFQHADEEGRTRGKGMIYVG